MKKYLYPKYFEFSNTGNIYIFLFISIFAIISNKYLDYFYFNENIVYNTYYHSLGIDRIKEIVNSKNKLEWFVLVVMPFTLIIKLIYFSICISIASVFVIDKIEFRYNFGILLRAEIIFSVMLLVKLVYIEIYSGVKTLDDFNIIPFSLLNSSNRKSIPSYLQYSVQLINIWEAIYGFVIIYLIKKKYEISFVNATKIYLFGYVVGLLLWTFFIMYLTIQFS